METAVAESLFYISQEKCVKSFVVLPNKMWYKRKSFVLKQYLVQEKAQRIGHKYDYVLAMPGVPTTNTSHQPLASPPPPPPQPWPPLSPSSTHYLCGCKFKPANCQEGIYLGTLTSLVKENNIFFLSCFFSFFSLSFYANTCIVSLVYGVLR